MTIPKDKASDLIAKLLVLIVRWLFIAAFAASLYGLHNLFWSLFAESKFVFWLLQASDIALALMLIGFVFLAHAINPKPTAMCELRKIVRGKLFGMQ